jgi:hypothetical protein
MFLVNSFVMQTTDHDQKNRKRGFKAWLLNLFRLTDEPTVKVYHGYGHNHCLTVFGHVFRLSPFPRKNYRQSFVRNTLALLRLFLVKPFNGVSVQVSWKGKTYTTTTDADGYFHLNWEDEEPFETGWTPVMVTALSGGQEIARAAGRIYIPGQTQYVIISDIDDTFLISHSANMRKRLYVLFTQNARSRGRLQVLSGITTCYHVPVLRRKRRTLFFMYRAASGTCMNTYWSLRPPTKSQEAFFCLAS